MATQFLLKVLRSGGGTKYGDGDIIECEPSGFQWGGSDLCVNVCIEIPEDLTAEERAAYTKPQYAPGDEGGPKVRHRDYRIDYGAKVTAKELTAIQARLTKCAIITGKFVKADILTK